jgi:hypothetical protein
LFADDLALLASTEDDLQCSIYNFHIVASKYNMEISIKKLKVMVFCGKEPVPSKICLNNKMKERTKDFTHLGYKLSFQGETDLPQKITKYTKTMGIINAVLKPTLVQKHTRIRLYKTLARPSLCYGSEVWTIREGDRNRLMACEMKFLRRTASYMKWNHEGNDILTELKIEPMTDYIKHYQERWSSHVNRMNAGRFLKAFLRY